MIPDPKKLIKKLDLKIPFLAVYDAPDLQCFTPVITPNTGEHTCIFKFFENWQKGDTLKLTADNFGCGGCGRCMFNVLNRNRHEFLTFLAETEGLKESTDLMGQWLDNDKPYTPENDNIYIGPYSAEKIAYLKTITFWVNPDQLSALLIGANYWYVPRDPTPPVIAPFGSGCMQLLSLFPDLDFPQAIIGSTDIAMRSFLPPNIMAFTVTLPMFKQLCNLDESSFLNKPFLKNLKKSRIAGKLSDYT